MPSLSAEPGFECFFKACRKGDATGKAVTVGDSAVPVLADASEITGLPRDRFEVWETTREEFEEFRPRRSP
jgi:hypothetical protein